MSNILQFPSSGERVALYTESRMYIGTSAESESIFDRPGLWLTDAAVVPIKGQVHPSDILRLSSVLVMWDQVVALSYAPDIDSPKYPE